MAGRTKPRTTRQKGIPFRPLGDKFIGRRQLLKTLQQELTAGTARLISQPIGVHADGGVGKTALAIELGWQLFEARQFDFVLFLNASTPETLQAELSSLAAGDVLNLPEQNTKEQEIRRVGVMRWLGTPENAKRTLLVLDNADSVEARQALRELLPKTAACAILITSRYGDKLSGVRRQEVDLFTAAEAREYLSRGLHAGLLAQSGGEATLDAVAQAVDHLPLALELVVSYMQETRQTPAEWLEERHKSPASTMSFHDADGVNYPVSLVRVWERSVERLSTEARTLLHWLAWIAPRPATLPLETLKALGDWPGLRVALSELAKVSLISWPVGGEEIFIHRVLQAVTRYGQKEEERRSSLASALSRLDASLLDPQWNEVGWRLWERLAPHCRTLLDYLREHALEPKATRMMNQLATWFYNRAEHTEAQPLLQRALAIFEKVLGPEHPDVANSLNNLAELYRAQGRYAEAQPPYQPVTRKNPSATFEHTRAAQRTAVTS